MKEQLREMLAQKAFGEIAELAVRKKRALSLLISLTYEEDRTIAHRAVEAMGIAADRVAESNVESIRSLLRRLYWLLLEESGGICWHAPAAMAEIVRHRFELFPDYSTIAISLLHTMADEDLPHFRASILHGIGRLAPIDREGVAGVIPEVVSCLDDPVSQNRGMAVWCLIRAGRDDLVLGREGLLADVGTVEIYEEGDVHSVRIGDLAQA